MEACQAARSLSQSCSYHTRCYGMPSSTAMPVNSISAVRSSIYMWFWMAQRPSSTGRPLPRVVMVAAQDPQEKRPLGYPAPARAVRLQLPLPLDRTGYGRAQQAGRQRWPVSRVKRSPGRGRSSRVRWSVASITRSTRSMQMHDAAVVVTLPLRLRRAWVGPAAGAG